MKIIPEVTCHRCGASYSSLRNRCPGCGTRRVSQSNRTPATTPSTVPGTPAAARAESNAKWQMIFGGILVVAILLAVVVMVSTSLAGAESGKIKTEPTPAPTAAIIEQPIVEAPPTPPPTPEPTVEKLNMTYYGSAKTEFLMHVGDEPVPLTATWTPADITGTVRWRSEDSSYVKINVDPEDGNKCTVECLADHSGPVKIYCTLYGTTVECLVYCAK